jgi:hypothetical protein
MWPFEVATDLARCLQTRSIVRPDHVAKWPASMALSQVGQVSHDVLFDCEFVNVVAGWLVAGLVNKLSSLGQGAWSQAKLPKTSGGIARALQNDVVAAHDTDCFGVETGLKTMVAELANGKRALLVSWGKRWARRAAMGSVGKLSKAVWVEVMMLPLGSRMLMPAVVAVFQHRDCRFLRNGRYSRCRRRLDGKWGSKVVQQYENIIVG